MARVGEDQSKAANATFAGQGQQAFQGAQQDLTQANTDQANLRSGKMVGADPYMNPQYLAAVNRLRSGALNQQNDAADQQLRATQARAGGMNSTATTGAIGKLAEDKMRLGSQLGAEQTAGDWTKNIGYQLNLAQQPVEAARAQTDLYRTATGGQSDALKNLTSFGLADYGPWMAAIQAAGGAAGSVIAPWMKAARAGSAGSNAADVPGML